MKQSEKKGVIMLESPHILHLHGNGEFTSGDVSFRSDFQLFLYPAKTILVTSTIELGLFSHGLDESGVWVLSGDLSDGRPIYCDNLSAMSCNHTWDINTGSRTDFRFTPFRTIEIGEKLDRPIKEAITPLVAFYEGQFDLHDDGWEISSQRGDIVAKSLQSISDLWHVPIEGMKLRLAHADATIKQYQEKAFEVTTLLSLASGNFINFHRQTFRDKSDSELEIWERRYCQLGIGRGLPHVQYYLKEILPNWNSLTPENQKVIRNATISLINSGHGWMEDKLLNITIAWEMLANAWIPSEKKPPEEIAELKSALKQTYGDWRKKYPDLDDSGFLGSRIIQALDWEKVVKKIEQLANDFNIDSDLVGTNFRRLIKIRNSVSHDGVLPEAEYLSKDSDPPYKLLLSSQFSLRVLLLKKIGYTGLIDSETDGAHTFVNISEAEFDI